MNNPIMRRDRMPVKKPQRQIYRIRSVAKKLARLAGINQIVAKQIIRLLINYEDYALATKFPDFCKWETYCQCCGPEFSLVFPDRAGKPGYCTGRSYGGVSACSEIEKDYEEARPRILAERAENRMKASRAKIAKALRDAEAKALMTELFEQLKAQAKTAAVPVVPESPDTERDLASPSPPMFCLFTERNVVA